MRKVPGHAPVRTPSRDATHFDACDEGQLSLSTKKTLLPITLFPKYMCHKLVGWKQWTAYVNE